MRWQVLFDGDYLGGGECARTLDFGLDVEQEAVFLQLANPQFALAILQKVDEVVECDLPGVICVNHLEQFVALLALNRGCDGAHEVAEHECVHEVALRFDLVVVQVCNVVQIRVHVAQRGTQCRFEHFLEVLLRYCSCISCFVLVDDFY